VDHGHPPLLCLWFPEVFPIGVEKESDSYLLLGKDC
jgi:hypothetical protein